MVKFGLTWQRKASIVFAVLLIAISIILTVFSISEVERDRLIREQELNNELQRIAENAIAQALSGFKEVEERIFRQYISDRIPLREEEIAGLCGEIAEREELVAEIFLVNSKGEISFPLAEPLFRRQQEPASPARSLLSFENNPLFRRAEEAEFRSEDFPLAISTYQNLLVASTNRAEKAALLSRIARCYYKSGRLPEAITTYRRLANDYHSETSTDGLPFALLAHYRVGTIHLDSGSSPAASDCFIDLFSRLIGAEWVLSENQYHFYRDQSEKGFNSALANIDDPESIGDLTERWRDLTHREDTRLQRMDFVEGSGQRIAPLLQARMANVNASPGVFQHIAEAVGGELCLGSFTPLNIEIAIGFLFNADLLRERLILPRMQNLPLREGWQLQIRDQSGLIIAGNVISNSDDSAPILAFSRGFEEYFPSWMIDILQEGESTSEELFGPKLFIYMLSGLVVVVAILFGGALAIKSTSKELKLAKLRSEFVSAVSHELRTPLTSIRYLSELLQRGRVRDDQKRQNYYDMLTSESERLSRFIENILDSSRIDAGTKEYVFEETNIASLVVETVALFRKQEATDKFKIECDVVEGMPIISVDREAVSRALLNLLDNAVKFSVSGCDIHVRARSDAGHVYLEVEDNGIGIAAEDQEKIFDKFFRSKSAIELGIKGSGIGLTLVAHTMKAHGGEIELDSKIGVGTKVTLKLPITRRSDWDGQDTNN